jgi:nitrite reductase/ring-hydroxylating ferredoxin subunit
MAHVLFPLSDLAPGELKAVEVGRLKIVVARMPDGTVRALRDRCSHMGAKLSHGRLVRHTDGDEVGEVHLMDTYVLQCPWHGFQFDVDTGRCVADPDGERVRSYEIRVEDGQVVLD